MPNKLSQFWYELKRRKVVRVITVYAAAAFVILELVDIITEPFGLPNWTLIFVVVILSVGLVVAIILSWIYDIHPEGGIIKTEPVHKKKTKEIPKSSKSWKIASFISFVVIVGLIVLNIIPRIMSKETFADLETSIAVLPFENMSLDEDDYYIGGAFTDEIIMELQKIKEFDRVLSRTSTMQFEKDRPTIPEIAEKLNVNYIVEGSIQRSQQHVRIRVQVIRAQNEDHIWGEEYDREWKDIFSIQDEIAVKVAHELKTTLSPEEKELIGTSQTSNIQAYDLYLQGRYFWNKRGKENLEKALEYFEQALTFDPDYSMAVAGLADCYYIMVVNQPILPKSEGFPKAKELARKAIALDKNIAEPHVTLGGVFWNEMKWEEAQKELVNGIELNPNYAEAYHNYAQVLSILRQNKKARMQMDKAIKLSPFQRNYLFVSSRLYYNDGKFNESIDELSKVHELYPEINFYYDIFKCYYRLGENLKALHALQESLRRNHDDTTALNHIKETSDIFNTSGMEGILNWLIEFYPYNNYDKAEWYAMLGEQDLALECLERASENPEFVQFFHINNDYDFSSLRSEPRFQAMIQKVGLSDYQVPD